MATKIIKFNNGTDTYAPVTLASAVQYNTGNTPISVQDAIGTVAQSLIDVANNANGSYMSVSGSTDPTIKILTPNGTEKSSYQFKGSGSGIGISTGHVTVSYANGAITFGTTYTDTNYYNKIIDKGLSGYQIASITASGTGSSTAIHVPQATSSNLGVVKLGYTDANKGYALKLDKDGKGYVNVPWTDTVPDYSNTYAPYSHTHGNITNDGKISGGASKVVVTDSSGKIGVSTNITTTELDCLNNVTSNIQKQINNINTTISSGMHMRGTTTTVPATNVAYVIGDSYVYAPSTSTATITIPAAQSQSAQDEVVGKGDMITYVATGKWAVIQNNIGDYVSSITVTDDNTWIQATPTTSASGAVTIDIQHIGPGTGSTKNATKGTDGSQLTHNSSMVMTGVNWKADGKGHVTEISYTLAKLPAETQLSRTGTNKNVTLTHGGKFTYISNLNVSEHAITYDFTTATLPSQGPDYGKIKVVKHSTAVTDAISSSTADVTLSSVNDNELVTFESVNKWIHIKATESSTAGSDKVQFSHALKGNGGTAALKKIAWDEAGHIGASADVTITKNLKYDVYPSDVDFTLPIGNAESTGNTIVTNIS